MFVLVLVVIAVFLILSFTKQINQYERGVVFSFGKFSKIAQPGWFVLIPVIQTMKKVDIRTKTLDVPNQEAITKDNIPVMINAVIYFRVRDAGKAVIEVEDFMYATSQLAQTTMRNCVGEYTLDELLQERHEVAKKNLDDCGHSE